MYIEVLIRLVNCLHFENILKSRIAKLSKGICKNILQYYSFCSLVYINIATHSNYQFN